MAAVSQHDLSQFTTIDESSLERLEVVGRGTFGTVYKARMHDKTVAVKSYDAESEFKAFTVEVRQLSRVNHPNIIKLYGACASEQPCLVMEYAENGSLHRMLHGKPKIKYSASHAMSWARQCAEGTAYLHAMTPKPLIHRDLKPPNLLLVNSGRTLKICDFGTVVDKSTLMTNNKGSAAWMAPEVFEGYSYTEKCDVFSWAIILWEVIARRQPYKEFGIAYSIMWRVHMGDRPPAIKNCPKPIHKLMTTCWDSTPSNRPSMEEVVTIMNALCSFFPNADEPIDFKKFEEDISTSETTMPYTTSTEQADDTENGLTNFNESSSFGLTGSYSTEREKDIRNGMLNSQNVNFEPLSVEVNPRAWDLNMDELQRALHDIPKSQGREHLTITETRPGGIPPDNFVEASGSSTALSDESDSSLDLDAMQLTLDPELQPELPDPNSRLSQQLFKEHKNLAKEYLKIETELAYKTQQRDELLSDPLEGEKRKDYLKKIHEKESLLGLKAYLQQVLNNSPQQSQPAADARPQEQQNPAVISEQTDDGWVHINT
ncbi:unnamed protein product [Hermetia illucens]|uniref:Mitogen-activated protein kinase kinase kinase 7 n=2 Tax=Hermetia illucens TaxID=343691 RepID=A0A7R8V2I3_HERIL|nr:unnamed protein product [Hermetia illucens]